MFPRIYLPTDAADFIRPASSVLGLWEQKIWCVHSVFAEIWIHHFGWDDLFSLIIYKFDAEIII